MVPAGGEESWVRRYLRVRGVCQILERLEGRAQCAACLAVGVGETGARLGAGEGGAPAG